MTKYEKTKAKTGFFEGIGNALGLGDNVKESEVDFNPEFSVKFLFLLQAF